jgi:hypothetical protein
MSENQDKYPGSSFASNVGEILMLLDLVEKIQQDTDQNTRQIKLILISITIVYWVIVFGLFYILTTIISIPILPFPAIIPLELLPGLLLAEGFSAFAFNLFDLESLKLRLFADEKLARDTLEVIRETLAFEKLSTLEKALFKARISRLEISPPQYSAFKSLTIVEQVKKLLFKLK